MMKLDESYKYSAEERKTIDPAREAGVGKTAIVEGIAWRIVRQDVPENLRNKKFSLDMAALVAGAKFKGE